MEQSRTPDEAPSGQDPAAPTPDANAPPANPAAAPTAPAPEAVSSRKTSDERKELLARAIQTQIAGGARVESQSDYQAVLIKGSKPNHLLHFFIGFLTFGLWWLVWAGIAIFGGEKRTVAQVDEFGNVSVQRL